MGAVGELLHRRFKLDAEALPKPGTAELESLYLFRGKNAGVCCCGWLCQHLVTGGGGVVVHTSLSLDLHMVISIAYRLVAQHTVLMDACP